MQCQRLYVRLHGGCDGEQFGIGTVGLLRNDVAKRGIARPSGLDHRDICGSSVRYTQCSHGPVGGRGPPT